MSYLKYLTLSIAFALVGSYAITKLNSKPKSETQLVWITNLDEAEKLSKKTKKPILANFTGSDWCGWCHKLAAEVFNTPEFKTWSDKNVVLLELDYPRTKTQSEALKTQNNGLMQAFQVQGFPTIWVFNVSLDKATKKYNIEQIGKTGYVRGGPKVFTDLVDDMIKQSKNKVSPQQDVKK